MKVARVIFTIAGVYGVLVLAPQYFMEPAGLTRPEYFYGFVGVALVWQIFFFVIARDPIRFRPAMLAAILEKVSFGAAAVALYAQGRLTLQILGAGIGDLVFALLFFWAWRATASAAPRTVPSAPPSPQGA